MSNTEKAANKDTIDVLMVLTERCNLNCRYCYENNKSNNRMSFEVARKIVDDELTLVKGTDKKIIFQLFGGEPSLEWKLIKKIYEYTMTINSPNFDSFFMITNGTTLDEKKKHWLVERKDTFTCGLSLDGTKEVQDINRSNSYDLIDFGFFLRTWANQKVKMTIDPFTINKMAECVIHCHELGFGVLCNLADGVEWKEDSTEILKNQLMKLVDYYDQHDNLPVCSILQMPILHAGVTERNRFPKWCGMGTNIHAYDTKGKKYPCQLYMSLANKKAEIPDIREYYPADVLNEKCKKCILFGCCPTCYGTNCIRGKNQFYHSEVECANIKTQFLATAFLMYKKYKKGLLTLTEPEEYLLLNGICKIQNEFANKI